MTLSILVVELIAVIGSIASLVSLYLFVWPANTPFTFAEGVACAIASCLIVTFGVIRLREYARLKPKTYHTKKAIRDYMYRWISSGERVAVFSRDMTWVDDDDMRELLRRKARKGELILCLPHAIALSTELGRLGTEIHVYPELDFIPSSRFTIINVGRHDSQVAMGRRIGAVHTIQEVAVGHDPLFALADDLVSVISRLDRCR